MATSVECKSRFPNGTILAGFSPDPSDSIGSFHKILGTVIVNGFAHGASSVVASFDRRACFCVVDCNAHVETFAALAGFDTAAPLDLFLELRTLDDAACRSMRERVSLRERRRWQTMIMYDLGKICGDVANDEHYTLGDFTILCARAISSAIGSGGRVVRFDILPRSAELVTRDDGKQDAPIRSDEKCFNDFEEQDVASICTNSARIQSHAEA